MKTINSEMSGKGVEGRIGTPTSRVDGRLKVTGQARYAAEFAADDLLYGVVVSGAIARGAISAIDTAAALAVDGVLHVLTHENRPSLPRFDRNYHDDDSPSGSPFRPLYDNNIVYSGQPVALVLATSFEAARHGAALVRVSYDVAAHQTDIDAAQKDAYHPDQSKGGFEPPPKPRGNADAALKKAEINVVADYATPVEHHNPMEMHATTVLVNADGSLTIYDKTQGVLNTQQFVTGVFGLKAEQVRVRSPFVGGAFGSGLRPQYQLFLAVLAAQEMKRSVRVVLTRQQMFSFGHRPATRHRLALGADKNGKLMAVRHSVVSETSRFEDYVEVAVNWSGSAYRCDNVSLDYKVAALDVYTPLDMRAPGATLGLYALESAMDELAHAAQVDPVALRLLNYADQDQNTGKPFSSKELKACYEQGAARFGWDQRKPAPRSMRRGKTLVGWGMAGGFWDAMQQPASAKAVLSADGSLAVSSATSDIGTGTYTAMTMIAASTLGLGIEDVTFTLGDSSLPQAPLEGGSWTVSSVGSAVKSACEKIRQKLFTIARSMPASPLAGASADDVEWTQGRVQLAGQPAKSLAIADIMRSDGLHRIEESVDEAPDRKQKKYTMQTHSAVFVEVEVDEDFGTVAVTRVVSAIAGGRVINPKAARSQIIGGVVWGIGMALHEETLTDHALGRFMNHSYAEYHIPVNADIPDIDVVFVEEHDDIVNPLGAKGMGEIGIVGVAAAVANAVFHATGKRVRDLPITLDKLA
jgi:xanthine dehydrogenase YagR molybdenum-binding subunit